MRSLSIVIEAAQCEAFRYRVPAGIPAAALGGMIRGRTRVSPKRARGTILGLNTIALSSPEQVSRRQFSAALRTGDGYALGALVLMLGLVIANRSIWDGWLARHDVLTAYMPWYKLVGERVRDLEIPGWNPYQFSGTPFAGDPQSGWMMIAVMIPFALFNPLTAFKIFVAIELIVAAFGMYTLARVLRLKPVAGLMAAVIFTFGPLAYQTNYCCSVRSNLAAWIPLTFLGIELSFRSQSRQGRFAAIMLGGFGFSQMLAGWLGQGAYNVALLMGFYILYRGLASPVRSAPVRERWLPMIVNGGGVFIAGALLNAAALLPRLATSGDTNLGAGDYERVGGYAYGPYKVTELLTQLVNDNFDSGRSTIPAVGIVLALLALALARKRFATPFWFGMTAVVIVIMLPTNPVTHLFFLLPRWKELHDHYVPQDGAVLMIGPAMLAGIALHELSERTALRRPELLMLPLIAIGFLMAWVQEFYLTATVAAVLGTIAVLLLAFRERIRPQFIGVLPAALVIVAFVQPMGLELFDAAAGTSMIDGWEETWNPTEQDEASPAISMSSTDPGGAGEFLQQQLIEEGPFRYIGYGGTGYPGDRSRPGTYTERRSWPETLAIIVNGRSIALHVYDMQGYNPVQLARYTNFISALNGFLQDYHNADLRPNAKAHLGLLDLLNVRYIVIDAKLPQNRDDVLALKNGNREVFRNDSVIIYENVSATEHAWIVHKTAQVDEDGAFTTIQNPEFDPTAIALVEGEQPTVTDPPAGADERATVTSYEPERIELQVSAASAGLVVISEIYDKGWSATIDGKSADISAVDGAFRGVAVDAGEHTIVLRYDPPELKIGLILSALSTLAMIGAFIWVGWRFVGERRE